MGVDFGNYQIFLGDSEREACYARLLARLPEILAKDGFQLTTEEKETGRSLAIGPPGRWVWVYDSSAPQGFAIELSEFGTVVTTSMYDSCLVHFFLYHNKRLIDRFVSAPEFYLNHIKRRRPQEAHKESDFYGQPEKWSETLAGTVDSDALRRTWQHTSADAILQQTAHLLGWDAVFCQGGYLIDDDGFCDIRYDEYFEQEGAETTLANVHVLHFDSPAD